MPDGDEIGGFRLPADWADDPIFSVRPYCRRAAWLWLIQHSVNGEVRVSYRSIAEIWKWDESYVRKFMSLLAEKKFLAANSSCITIRNHERFQVSPQSGSAIPARKERVTQAEFEHWWAWWPHKVGKDTARKAYDRARQKASAPELLEGVKRYKATKPASIPWCNPATWLNGGRWSDEPDYGGNSELPLSGAVDHVGACNCGECHAEEWWRNRVAVWVQKGRVMRDWNRDHGLAPTLPATRVPLSIRREFGLV